MKRLYLDDLRKPINSHQELGYDIYREDWDVVRNFDEFRDYIVKHGLPDIISFDHDLHPDHYTPKHLWTDYHKSKEFQEMIFSEIPNGLICAEWLIDYCEVTKQRLPTYLVHSANPVGRDNIYYTLRKYEENVNRNIR